MDRRPPAVEDGAVDRDALARTDRISSPTTRRVGIDAELFVAVELDGLARGERADAVDGGAGPQRASLLEQPADLEEQRDERRGDEVAGRRGGEDRDRDELIGRAARVAGDDAANARISVGTPRRRARRSPRHSSPICH